MRKILSLFIAMMTILVTSITNINVIQAEGPATEAIAYIWQNDTATTPMSLYSLDTVLGYARDGYTIYMNKDWEISSPISIKSGEKFVIEMNGHKISRNLSKSVDYGEIFNLASGATLYLEGKGDSRVTTETDVTKTEFTYEGYNETVYSSSTAKCTLKVTSGGLVTGGYSDKTAGAIYMSSGSKLYLTNVAVNGNASDSSSANGALRLSGDNCYVEMDNAQISHNYAYSAGGAIKVDGSNCHVIMKNNSLISYNITSESNTDFHGGGIAALGNNFTLDMYSSSIEYNNSKNGSGGALYVSKTATVTMLNSKMDHNVGNNGGGAIAVNGKITLNGNHTSSISYNESRYGGAVDLEQDSKNSIFRNVNFIGNYASVSGGVFYLNSKNNSIIECVMKKNSACGDGGAVYVNEDYNEIRDCTITDNWNEYFEMTGPSYGGGIYVYYEYDIYMYGKNIVENNKNTSGDFDDVYLDSLWFFYDAYIKGSADEGSHIGLRSNSSSKNKLGVDVTNYIEGTYFMDDSSNLHVVYYSSDKTLYQEKGESTKYNLTINGTVVGKYYSGQNATVYDNNDDYERVFLNWKNSDDISITTEQKEQRAFDINMPSHDVSVNAEYLDRLKTITLTVLGDIPTATKELPTWIKYTYGPDDTSRWTSDIEWLEVSSTTTPTSGNAKYNTTYELKFQLPQDISKGISFSNEIKKDLNNVTIKFSDSDTVIHASSITLSGAGTLTVISEPLTTEKRLITGFRTDSITVQEGTSLNDLINAFPDTAVGYDEKGYEEKLNVDKQNIKEADLTDLVLNGKVIYPTDGKTTIVLPIVASTELDIAKSAKFKVKVNVTELPTINSITEEFVTVKEGTSKADFLNELPENAEIIASDGSIKFLTVDVNSIGEQLDAHLTDDKIDYSKGSTFELNLDVVTDGTVKNPDTKKLKVNVTVSEKDKVETPTVNPTSGEYKDEQLTTEGNLVVTISYGDSAQIKGDTIHYIIDQETEQTCSLSESTTSCTVTLEGTAKEKVTHTLEVWASGTEEYNDSTHIKNTYVLDNRITVEVPKVDVDSGTYNREKLVVTPSTTSGAEIWYTLNDSDPIKYDSSSKGIILTTEADVQKIYRLNIWAVVDGVSSEVVQKEYVLDYHVDKYDVTINCSDTAIVPEGETAWTTSVTQSYEKDTKVTIYAPEEEGRVFEKWTDKDGKTLSTDLWYTYDKLTENKTIYAVYNPVITEIDFSIPYPVGGEALATKDQIKATATVAGTKGKDICNYFDLENLSWIPEGEIADYETRYTLALPINHNIQNVKYVLADDIVVKVNDETEVVANIDTAKLIAYLTFPTTDIHQYILKEVEPVQDITMSYTDAYKQQVAQEEERQTEDPKNIWDLPKETNLIVDDGSKLSSIITWDIPEFNKDSWAEQTIEVEGTVAIPSNVTQGEVSNKVKLTIHVLAPEQVSTPTSSVPTGTYKDTQIVSLTSETEGAKLYYTIDGTEPTKDSLLYTGSFKVKETTTIKVIAVYDGMIDSKVSTYTITIDRTPEPTDEPIPTVTPTTAPTASPTPTPTATPETKKITPKKSSGWDDGGPFTTDTCGNVFDRWGNKIYEAKGCNVGGYNLVPTDTKE